MMNELQRYKTVVIILLTLCIGSWGCEDFFVKDIEKKEVTVLAPVDSMKTVYGEITFAWEEMEGADNYRLVVVSPDFSRIEWYLLDTVVSGHYFTHSFPVGGYQWGIRAENNGYVSRYVYRSVTILSETENEESEDQTSGEE